MSNGRPSYTKGQNHKLFPSEIHFKVHSGNHYIDLFKTKTKQTTRTIHSYSLWAYRCFAILFQNLKLSLQTKEKANTSMPTDSEKEPRGRIMPLIHINRDSSFSYCSFVWKRYMFWLVYSMFSPTHTWLLSSSVYILHVRGGLKCQVKLHNKPVDLTAIRPFR